MKYSSLNVKKDTTVNHRNSEKYLSYFERLALSFSLHDTSRYLSLNIAETDKL